MAGGYRISDPAGDLAVAAALLSAHAERTLPSSRVIFGEVALSGEVRPVAHGALRLREAGKLGFQSAVGPVLPPAGPDRPKGGPDYASYSSLNDFVNAVLGRG